MRNKMLWTGISVGMVIGLLLAMAGVALAGSLTPSVGPTGAASQMYTLEQIWQRLNNGAVGAKMSSFTEPAAAPGTGTMHTLDDLMAAAPAADAINGATTAEVASGKTFWGLTDGQWGLRTGTASLGNTYNAGVPKTRQTGSFAAGDDGALQKGVAWPNPRFTDTGNGTVTDNLTGLIWLKNANCFGGQAWAVALTSANNLANGSCGLADGSAAGDWRLPNVRELLSLVDYGRRGPALPSGHPFISVINDYYWTSTSFDVNNAFSMYVFFGSVSSSMKHSGYCAWPVRGGTP